MLKINNLIKELNTIYSNKFHSISNGEHSSSTETNATQIPSLTISTSRCYGTDSKAYPSVVRPFLNVMLAEQHKEVNPNYEITDEDPDNWTQGEEHNLKIKRLTPPSFDFEIKIDVNINGGETSEDAFIDDGRLDFEKDITVIPNSDNIDISFTIDGKDVSDGFSKEGIEETRGLNTNGYDFVDIGSSVIWATSNVGAENTEEIGQYFQWGDTQGYTKEEVLDEVKLFDWPHYKFSGSDEIENYYNKYQLTKYCSKTEYGYNNQFVDNLYILEPIDDAAHINMKGDWRIPTVYEAQDLLDKCKNTSPWMGKILQFTSNLYPDYNIIFPKSGGAIEQRYEGESHVYIWLNQLHNYDYYGCLLYLGDVIGSSLPAISSRYRIYGFPVRGVISKPINLEYIDLGLSVNWATCNIGASTPQEYGLYFQWGDTQGYPTMISPNTWGLWGINRVKLCSWNDYKWGNYELNTLTKYCSDINYGAVDNKTMLDLEDDAATVHMGKDWRMPTQAEYIELFNACDNKYVSSYNGINVEGMLFTLKTDSSKQLFFPSAGRCFNSYRVNCQYPNVEEVYSDDEVTVDDYSENYGFYWAKELRYEDSAYAAAFQRWANGKSCSLYDRYYGFTIRGVLPKNI